MDLIELVNQCHRDSRRWFPDHSDDLAMHTLCIAGEAGEVANLVKKVVRGSHTIDELRSEIGEEVIDVLIYICNAIAILGIDPIKVYAIKRRKNEQRFGSCNRADNGTPE